MRSILEKAIVHLLNEEQDKAEALFHRFMVEKARRIHESLRTGETALTEGWDDEITSEEYLTDDDLASVEDGDEPAMDMGADEAGDELAGDLDADASADLDAAAGDEADADADLDAAADDEAEADEVEGDTDERLADMEDQIEKLTAEFDKMMGEIETDGDDLGDDLNGDDLDGDDAALAGDDLGDDLGGDAAMADRMEDDVTDAEPAQPGMDDDDDEMHEGKKGKIPPQFLKNIKKKKGVKEDDADDEDMNEDVSRAKTPDNMKAMQKNKGTAAKEKVRDPTKPAERQEAGYEKRDSKEKVKEAEDEDLDDITESVLDELERVSVEMTAGKEVADGKKITSSNDKSLINTPNAGEHGGAKPIKTINKTHTGFDRETPPVKKTWAARKNTVKGNADNVFKPISTDGDKSAILHKDFAAGKSGPGPTSKKF